MKYYTFLLFVSIPFFLFSQNTGSLSVGIESNSQYYIDDKVTGDFEEDNPFRANNYLKVDYTVGGINLGVQFESYAPQSLLNYSPNFDSKFNLATFQAGYSNDIFELKFGHFYEQFGNGLVFRSWEDRQLGINNAVLGTFVKIKPGNRFDISGFIGQQRVGFSYSQGTLSGVDVNYDFSSEKTNFRLGASLVNRNDKINSIEKDFSPDTRAYSGRINFGTGNFYSNLEAVVKTKDAYAVENVINDKSLYYGNALLLEFGYSAKGFGLNTTLRRLENMNFYTERSAAGNTFNELIVNYLPALTKQHDYLLTNIYVYQSQPGLSISSNLQKAGEIGGQIDLYYKFKRGTAVGGKYGTKLAVNYANWHGLDAKYNVEFDRVEVNYAGIGDTYFRDLNFEVRKKFSKKLSGIFTYVNSYYNKPVIEETVNDDIVKLNIVVAEATYKLKPTQSIRLEGQHLWTKQDKKNWVAATAEFNMNTNWSIFANDMYNYANEEHQDHYYSVGLGYNKNRTSIALRYGRTRGGLLCVGGVCRQVPPATGLTCNITTSF